MIRTVADLRTLSTDVIKIAQKTDPTKTEGKRLLGLITDILDTVDDLVLQQGLSISANMQQQRTDILNNINTDLININNSIQQYITSNAPDLSIFQKKSDVVTYDLSKYQPIATAFTGDYTKLTNKPTIPTMPDLSGYQQKTDAIAYSRLTGVPAGFSGNYVDLINKPTIPTYDLSIYRKTADTIDYTSLINKPSIITSYTQLTDKPTIPTYDLSLYRKTSDAISYADLTNKPTIVTDYTQLANKPSMSKLLWNQTANFVLTNSVVETNSLVTGNGSLILEANPVVGTTFRLTGRGLFNTQTLGPTPTLTIKLYLGNTVIASGSVASFLLGATNRPLSFYVDMLIPTANAIYAQGSMSYFATIADNLSAAPILSGTGGNVAVDLTVVNQLKMTLTWSSASTSNTIQMKIINLEKLNN